MVVGNLFYQLLSSPQCTTALLYCVQFRNALGMHSQCRPSALLLAEHAPIAKSLYTLYMNPPYCRVWVCVPGKAARANVHSLHALILLSFLWYAGSMDSSPIFGRATCLYLGTSCAFACSRELVHSW